MRAGHLFSLLAAASVLAPVACSASESAAQDQAASTKDAGPATGPATTTEAAAEEAPRPNILFILFDDLGYGQLGVTGHPTIRTPNIDRLAQDGMIFTNAYAGGTVCSPSRISLMTGRDASRLSSAANDILLRPEDRTVAHLLSEAGYKTALFGKFGIGVQFGATDPMAMGFQHWVGVLHNIEAHRQYPPFLYRDNAVTFVRENVAGAKGAYAQRLYTDAALDFLADQQGEPPFFAFMSYTAPHSEMAAPEDFVAPYRGKFTETPYNGLAGPTPASHFPDYYPEAIDQPNAVQAGMVAALDAYVGELLDALEQQGLARNTLVILSSDNGPHAEGGGDPIALKAAGPYRGGKRDLTEGGIHMPFIARWPGVISAGRVEDKPVMFADIMPTLAALAGAPEAAAASGANGVSLAALLAEETADIPERMLYWTFARQLGDPNSGVAGAIEQAGRLGDWKAIRAEKDAPIRLYNLADDPGETRDIASDHQAIAADFAARFDARLAEQARYR